MEFKARYTENAHHIRTQNLRPDGSALYMKFDTGAMNTVISIWALTSDVGLAGSVIERLRQRDFKSRVFQSASGNAMTGYRTRAENVCLSGFFVPVFYYYLLIDVKTNAALLGDDFLSCCDYHHTAKGDIEVIAWHEELYGDTEKTVFQQNEINALLKSE